MLILSSINPTAFRLSSLTLFFTLTFISITFYRTPTFTWYLSIFSLFLYTSYPTSLFFSLLSSSTHSSLSNSLLLLSISRLLAISPVIEVKQRRAWLVHRWIVRVAPSWQDMTQRESNVGCPSVCTRARSQNSPAPTTVSGTDIGMTTDPLSLVQWGGTSAGSCFPRPVAHCPQTETQLIFSLFKDRDTT